VGKSIKLTEKQWDDLDLLRFTTPSADVFRNCLIILQSDTGMTIRQIADFLRCSPETVKRVRRLYRQGGIKALKPVPPPGRTSRATAGFLQTLREAVQTNPQTLGYGFATWSATRLAAHLTKVTGTRFSDDQIRRLLHQEGFSVHRPKHTMKGKRDEAAYRKAKRKLRGLKKQAVRKDAPEALVFQDEVEIHRHPSLARMWAPVGSQPEVPAPGKNEKKVVYGGVDYATGQTTYTVADTKSGMNFLVFLIALVAAYAGRKVRLVCDNGRFHHTKAVQEWLAVNKHRIEIYWLPPYCPSLNLIERLWGHLKRTVLANVLFETIDDLVVAFRRGLGRINGHRDQMGFMFNHDDLGCDKLKKAG
jgi:transposase